MVRILYPPKDAVMFALENIIPGERVCYFTGEDMTQAPRSVRDLSRALWEQGRIALVRKVSEKQTQGERRAFDYLACGFRPPFHVPRPYFSAQ